jgi:hypothetical protein
MFTAGMNQAAVTYITVLSDEKMRVIAVLRLHLRVALIAERFWVTYKKI